MKTCTEPGCLSPQFGGSKCKYHQFVRYMKGGDLHVLRKKKQEPVKRRTSKRQKNEKYYAVEAKERFLQAVAEKTNICFFCGREVKDYNGWHHIRHRTGNRLRDWRYIVLAHDECHLNYHDMSYDRISQEPWYAGFLERLKVVDPETYQKELRWAEKSHKLNPKIFDEEIE